MKYILTLILSIMLTTGFAQYIEFTYDAAGNRTRREYVSPSPNPDFDNHKKTSQDHASTSDDGAVLVADEQYNHGLNRALLFPNPTKSGTILL